MSKQIIIFTTTTCKACPPVKNYLKYKNLVYEEKNIEDLDNLKELFTYTNKRIMPTTVIKSEHGNTVVYGANISHLAEATRDLL